MNVSASTYAPVRRVANSNAVENALDMLSAEEKKELILFLDFLISSQDTQEQPTCFQE